MDLFKNSPDKYNSRRKSILYQRELEDIIKQFKVAQQTKNIDPIKKRASQARMYLLKRQRGREEISAQMRNKQKRHSSTRRKTRQSMNMTRMGSDTDDNGSESESSGDEIDPRDMKLMRDGLVRLNNKK